MMNKTTENIRDKFKKLVSSKTEHESIERDSAILQAGYLSEIERLYQNIGLNRKELAIEIGTSPSYLTQVFRGDKPLNFLTLAKIKRALNLRFEVKAEFIEEKKNLFTTKINSNSTIIPTYTTSLGEGISMVNTISNNELVIPKINKFQYNGDVEFA